MDRWVTSDMHLYSINVLKARPWRTVEDMNSALISNFNELIAPEDELTIIGDFVFGSEGTVLDMLNALHGRKRLVLGNWDRNISTPLLRSRFEWVKPIYEEEYLGETIIYNHYPILTTDIRFNPGAIHLYGHVHGNTGIRVKTLLAPRSYNVGVDFNGFKPVLLDDIIKKV